MASAAPATVLGVHPVFSSNKEGTGELLRDPVGSSAHWIQFSRVTLPVTGDRKTPYSAFPLPTFMRATGWII